MKRLRHIAGWMAIASIPALPTMLGAIHFYGPEMFAGDDGAFCLMASGVAATMVLCLSGLYLLFDGEL